MRAADKKFEQKVFAAYRQEAWTDESLMEVILARERRAVVRLVRRIGDEVEAGESATSAIDKLLAALKRKAT
jgi:hypothetical protein